MSEQATATQEQSAELTIADLNAMKSIIDVASERGAFKPNEMTAVGTVYSKLETFLKAVAEQQAAQAEAEGQAQPAAAPAGE